MSLDADHGPAQPRKRGSQPGVARGSYKPRRIKPKEPQTAEELAALDERAREYWRDLYDANVKVFAPELGRYVAVRTYVPPMPELERDKCDAECTSKVCSGCGLDWELDHFSPSSRGRCGVKSRCKSCCAKYARERASNPQGKAARARAQEKFRAHLAAEERQKKERAAFIEAASKTQAGRALLDALGMNQDARQKGWKC